VECLDVRERLAEHAVGTLPPEDGREVERHIEWCAGCRKEADELAAAAAVVGLTLPQAEPPPPLEDRVVARVRSVAGPPGHRRARSSRALRTTTVIAAVVGLVGMGLAGGLLARQQSTEQKLDASREQASRELNRLEALLAEFRSGGVRPQELRRAVLSPPVGEDGGGGALLLSSPRFEDIIVVLLGGLHQASGPYRVSLVRDSGRALALGTVTKLDAGGGATLAREFARDLRGYRSVQVRGAQGKLVLSGVLEPQA
jgi:hypothetical protein